MVDPDSRRSQDEDFGELVYWLVNNVESCLAAKKLIDADLDPEKRHSLANDFVVVNLFRHFPAECMEFFNDVFDHYGHQVQMPEHIVKRIQNDNDFYDVVNPNL